MALQQTVLTLVVPHDHVPVFIVVQIHKRVELDMRFQKRQNLRGLFSRNTVDGSSVAGSRKIFLSPVSGWVKTNGWCNPLNKRSSPVSATVCLVRENPTTTILGVNIISSETFKTLLPFLRQRTVCSRGVSKRSGTCLPIVWYGKIKCCIRLRVNAIKMKYEILCVDEHPTSKFWSHH